MLLKDVCEKHLSTMEAKILRDLISFEHVSYEKLRETLYGDLENGGPYYAEHIIRLYINRIRKKVLKKWKIIRIRCKLYALEEKK